MKRLICLCLLIAGCSSSNHGNNPPYERINEHAKTTKKTETPSNLRSIKDIPKFEKTKNLMSPGFLFSLSHPTDSKLQGTFRAGFDGILTLPYGVKIDVNGLTFPELKEKVLEGYHSFFQRGAQNVHFNLVKKEYWVEVRGFVKKSGTYLVKRKESLDKVIDMAGGLSSGNVKQDFYMVSVKQQDTSYSVSLNQYYENNVFGNAFTWTGGDVIFINLSNEVSDVAPTVEVLGGVASPGKTLYKDGENIFYYLGKRGGVIPNLGYEEVFVIRQSAHGLERINFNITKMETIPVIKPGDTILLNAERKTTADRIWERVLQISSVLATVAIWIIAL